MRLLPCPKCGKYPKIIEGFEEASAICKPFLRNAHLIVYGDDTLDVIEEWNEEVMKYWNPVYTDNVGNKEDA